MAEVEHIKEPGRPDAVSVDGRVYVSEQAFVLAEKQIEILAGKLADKQRSRASHAHQFAEIRDLWQNIPESLADAPFAKSADHFRKHALIATGYCDTEVIDCQTHAIACQVAPVVASIARKAHGYAIVTVKGSLITCNTPHSQSFDDMGGPQFYECKDRILHWMHQLLGTRS